MVDESVVVGAILHQTFPGRNVLDLNGLSQPLLLISFNRIWREKLDKVQRCAYFIWMRL